ncbi:MAG: HNH endonuclease, partial [Acidimicrobiia bacterium]|nr:HNH endonuclease [Acidimicrobiia bacterium]
SRLQPAIDDPDGFTVGVGRTSRKIPHWLRRLLDDRDGGCRFPGCGRTRWTHAHHIIHWANEGPTNLDNLIILCGFHHRLVHRDGWRIVGNPNGVVVFLDRWGFEYRPARSQAVMADRVEQLLEHLDYYYDYRLGRLATANSPP